MTLDLAHLLDIFLAESHEYVQALDVALVALEHAASNGGVDRSALDEIFRATHSLKGMCGMMGYQSMAALAHAMEESLLDLRDGGAQLDRPRLDTLVEYVDALETELEQIEGQAGPGTLDAVAARLGVTVPAAGDQDHEGQQIAAVSAGTGAFALEPGDIRVLVRLAPDTDLPAARAMVVFRELGEIAQVLETVPADPTDFQGLTLEAWTRGADPATIRHVLARLPEIDAVECTGEDAPAPAPSPTGRPTASAPARVEPTVRVAATRLDRLMFQVQEVLTASARLDLALPDDAAPALRSAMADVLTQARQLQGSVMQVRMTPLDTAFARVPRLVRELARRLDKQVSLIVDGSDTELDRSTVDALADPLVHLVRNALDHGLEPADERVAAGKPAAGTLRITARHVAGSVEVVVEDDGRGIDAEAVAARAVGRGMLDPAEVERARGAGQMLDLLLRPGVSGSATTTDISGRGVGLDAVRATVRDLGGDLTIGSSPTRGTAVTLSLPLTLAIMPTLLVRIGDDDAAIPLDRVSRIMPLTGSSTREAAGVDLFVATEGTTHRLLHLGPAIGRVSDLTSPSYAVMVDTSAGRIAVAVDVIDGRRDLATRPLPDALAADGLPLLGIGMLPDGSLTTIVDCDRLTATGAAQVVMQG